MEEVSCVREQIIESLRDDNKNLKNEFISVKQLIDNNEQKSRNNCLVIHGIPESKHDNTDELTLKIINEAVNVSISLENIERSHRLGAKKTVNTRPRPIIVKFASMRKRMEVFRNKKNLKGKKINITESLTAMSLLEKGKIWLQKCMDN